MDTLSDELIEHVRGSFARQGLMAHLGARITRLDHGRCELEVDHRPELTQQHGFFHAGVTSALADTAGGYAGLSTFAVTDSVLTVDFGLNLLAPAAGERLVAVGEVVRAGRTLTVCRLDAYAVQGDRRVHVATGQQTLIRLADRADGPA